MPWHWSCRWFSLFQVNPCAGANLQDEDVKLWSYNIRVYIALIHQFPLDQHSPLQMSSKTSSCSLKHLLTGFYKIMIDVTFHSLPFPRPLTGPSCICGVAKLWILLSAIPCWKWCNVNLQLKHFALVILSFYPECEITKLWVTCSFPRLCF